jgi:hypothetical protein
MHVPAFLAGTGTAAAELMAAWSDYYAGAKCTVQGNSLEPHFLQDGGEACLIFYATARTD